MPPRNQPRMLSADLLLPPRRETHGSYYGGARPVLLAERARTAVAVGQCALCRHPVWPGDRVADLTGGQGTAHLGCIGMAARR